MTTTTVSSGVTSTGIALNNGDIENILNGGTAIATTINSGGSAHVSSGGIASGSVVFSGGFEFVLLGGSANATSVRNGGQQWVSSGGVAVGAAISRGAAEAIFAGGVASNATVSSGGQQSVFGKASGTIVEGGGSETVGSGGSAVGMTVNAGAIETVDQGGLAISTHLNSGAIEDVLGDAAGTVISAGGTELISSFLGVNGVLFNTIVEVGGTIDVSFLPFAAGGSASFSSSTHKLTVSQGGHTYSQTLSGSYTGLTFELVPDGGSGTSIVLACFRRGTRITTAHREVAVEALSIGDEVLTRGEGFSPIVWIGHRIIDCQRHPEPHLVWPVRICAHAFGSGLPRSDLWLSPDHALFCDDVLIPVKHLIDGHAIAQVAVNTVEYYHLELRRHAVMLAEGLPAESYLDAGDRSSFENGGGALTLHPDFASRAWEATGCAPLVIGGPPLDAARALVARNAATLLSRCAAAP